MSKCLLFAGVLAAFITLSGLPGLLTNPPRKGPYSDVLASSNKLESRQIHLALKSPTIAAANHVSQASFATLNPSSLQASMVRRDNLGALQNDTFVTKQDIDLGEIFIDGVK